ncbi:MAG: 30S ribosomal protein S16 [Patescibacteria group bacterium]|jgi:small subunit ribosomal protein S16
MLAIRLTRVGKKNSPAYRVVVAEKTRAVKGKFIEILGHYNPTRKPKDLVIDQERAVFWLGRGAQPSDTVKNLMVDLGYFPKEAKVAKVYGKPQSKKAQKEAA